MRKILIALFFILVVGVLSGSSQSINNVPIREINLKYLEVIVNYNSNGAFSGFTLDLGKENRIFTSRDLVLRDANGMVLKFGSITDILNFFDKNGFVLNQTYTIGGNGSQSFCHLVLVRNR